MVDSLTPEHQYVVGQARPTFAGLFEEFAAANALARARGQWLMDVEYGAHPRQRIDVCLASREAVGTVLYFHAGYWQSRDKGQFHFLAPALCRAGFHVAFVGYPLCPEVSLAALIASVRDAVPAIVQALPECPKPLPLFATGHSAGAHLSVELALAQHDATLAQHRLCGLVPISGIYDLSPLLETTLNEHLRLDIQAARAASPVLRVRAGMPPATFLVGAEETAAFLDQNRGMAAAWSMAGNRADCHALPGLDHFSLLSVLSRSNGPLVQRLRFLCNSVN